MVPCVSLATSGESLAGMLTAWCLQSVTDRLFEPHNGDIVVDGPIERLFGLLIVVGCSAVVD